MSSDFNDFTKCKVDIRAAVTVSSKTPRDRGAAEAQPSDETSTSKSSFIFSKNKNYYTYDYNFKDDGQEEEERVTPELQRNSHTWGIVDEPRKRRGTQTDVRYCCCNYCHGKRSPREFTCNLDRKRDKCGHIHVNCWANQTDIICKLCCPE